MLSKYLLKEFKKIYLEEYGVELSEQEATELANNFINLMKILFKTEANNLTTPQE